MKKATATFDRIHFQDPWKMPIHQGLLKFRMTYPNLLKSALQDLEYHFFTEFNAFFPD